MSNRTWAAAAIVGAALSIAAVAPATASAATPSGPAPVTAAAPAAADEVYCTYRITYRTEIWSGHPAQGKQAKVVGYAEAGATYNAPQVAPLGYRIVGPGYRSINAAAMTQIGRCYE